MFTQWFSLRPCRLQAVSTASTVVVVGSHVVTDGYVDAIQPHPRVLDV